MIVSRQHGPSASPRRRGLALIEVAVSALIVGGMVVAALTAVGASGTSQYTIRQRQQARLLAESLMAEILKQPYEDPDGPADGIGLEGGETGDGNRLLWDDVDDYDGWSATPPQDKNGSPLTWADGFTRTVQVKWVALNDPGQSSVSATGVKRISVTVKHGDRVLVELHSLRTSAWEDPAELQGDGR